MNDLQAPLGLPQLSRLECMHKMQVHPADRCDALLLDLPLKLPVRMPAWHLYVVESDVSGTRKNRVQLFQALRAADIGVNVHYIPIHTQPYYRELGFLHGQFPAAEKYYAMVEWFDETCGELDDYLAKDQLTENTVTL